MTNILDKAIYVSARSGLRKPALVVATPESLDEHGTLTLDEGHVNLTVFSPSGKVYGVHNIPTKDIFDGAVAQDGQFDEDGDPVASYRGYFETV